MAKIGKLFFFPFWISILFSFSVFAEVKVTAFVDQNEVGIGDTVTITVSVTSNESFEASEPRIPSLSGFTLVNSWSSNSTSSKLMQGPRGMQFETVRRQDFNYQLTPQNLGLQQVEAFEVVVDGKPYYTKPFTIKISNTKTAPPSQQQRQRQPPQIPGMPSFEDIDEADELFQQLLQRGGIGRGQGQGRGGAPPIGNEGDQRVTPPPANKLNKHNPNEAFFVQVELDKIEAYAGEQITASWYLYTRGNILSLDRLKFPDLKGFWKEAIDEVLSLTFQHEVVNGVAYKKALLASHALFPRNAGIAVVDEYKVKASVQSGNGLFGFGQPYTYTRSSERVQVKVKPLPTAGKPQDFTGAVGQFEMRSSVEAQNFPVNQPFTLKVRFDGAGNAKTIELPELTLPPGLELYDKKSDTKFFKNGRSFKEFEVLIIPREAGEKTIPGLTASMFDPSTGRYYTRTAAPIKIQVTPAANADQGGSLRLTDRLKSAPAEKKNVLPDILLSYESSSQTKSQVLFVFQILVWVFVMTALGLKGYFELGRKRKTFDIRTAYKKRVMKIKTALEKGKPDQWRMTANDVSNLIYFVLGEISGQGGASRELEKLLDLCPPSVRRELGDELKKKIELFQAIGFAPEELVSKYKDHKILESEFEGAQKVLERVLDLGSK